MAILAWFLQIKQRFKRKDSGIVAAVGFRAKPPMLPHDDTQARLHADLLLIELRVSGYIYRAQPA